MSWVSISAQAKMTLFSFLWVALLPHFPGIVNSPKPSVLLTANPYAVPSLHLQDRVASTPYSYSPLPLKVPVLQPSELQPQLLWPLEAAVDWHRWSATAAVAVVAKPNAAHLTSGVAHSTLTPNLCKSYGKVAPVETGANAEGFMIQVKNVVIGQVRSRQAAENVANQIRQAVPSLEANPSGITPSLSEVLAAGQVDGKTVFVLPDRDPDDAASPNEPTALEATQWVNNLRLAFGATPLDPIQVQMVAYGLGETHQSFGGTASWYGPYFHGRQTATGETFNQHDMTAAHKTLPFGTYLKVRNQLNGKTVVVRINDRGPYIGERSLDLSYAAAQCLGGDQTGVIPYQATILAPGFPQAWQREDVVAAMP